MPLGTNYVLTKERHFPRLLGDFKLVTAMAELEPGGVLICFGTGIIIPPSSFKRFKRAYNFHGASPAYPGRDPHHWASYDGVGSFGATCHEMTKLVDDGPIVGTLTLGMPIASPPAAYRAVGEIAMYALFDALVDRLLTEGVPPNGEKWGTKTCRQDLLDMCDLRGLSGVETWRRKMVFEGFEWIT